MTKREKAGIWIALTGLFSLILATALLHQDRQSRAAELVDLQLVLAVDVSASVDPKEFQLQKRGIYEAFLHPDVIRAIRQAGNLGVAVTVVQWSGPGEQATAVDWALVRDRKSAAALSDKVRAMPRYAAGMTYIAGAIRFSAARIEDSPFEGTRRVIDVSGDGPSDAGSSRVQRDRAVALGITINGLVIYSTNLGLGELANKDLHDHYAKYVIGGPGAFLMKANDYEDYRIAIRRKLIREITGVFAAGLEHRSGKWKLVSGKISSQTRS